MPEKKKPLFNAGPTEKKSTEITSIKNRYYGKDKLDKNLNTPSVYGRKMSVWGPNYDTPEDRQRERNELEKIDPQGKRGGDIELKSEKKKRR
jgi:hypothetical protein